MSYLAEVTLRSAAGIAGLSDQLRRRHETFLIDAQRDDGGFAGRRGESDLYYTGFGVRALAVLGKLDADRAGRVVGFLKDRFSPDLPAMDFFSLVTSAVMTQATTGKSLFAELQIDVRKAVAEFFRPLRRDDGGYAKTARSGPSSTYSTFLVAACQQLVGVPLETPDRMAELIRGRRRSDGGFVEIEPMRQSGANPTAAAIGLLKIVGLLDEPVAEPAAGFIAGMQTPQGGLRANSRIPAADLLSTFTGLNALQDIGALGKVDTSAAARFTESLQMPDGGFRAGTWDDVADVEYTFYGLGVLGLSIYGS